MFNYQQEVDFPAYLEDIVSLFYGLTRDDFKVLGFAYAEKQVLLIHDQKSSN